MRRPTFKVKEGELWEFDNPESKSWERHALLWIVKADHQSNNPEKDLFTYILLDSSDEDVPHMAHALHLTMRCEEFKHLWKRLA